MLKTLTNKRAGIIPLFITSQHSTQYPNTGSILYDSIKPMFMLAQCLGLFPMTNLHSSITMKPASLTSFLRIPLIIALGYHVFDVVYVSQKMLREEEDIEDEETQTQKAFYYKTPYICVILLERLNGICVFTYVLWASKKFPRHFMAWQVLNPLLENCSKSLRRFTMTVTMFAFLLALVQALLMAKLGEEESNLWQKIFAVTCFLANYAVLHVQACCLVFSIALFWGFKTIRLEMETLLLPRLVKAPDDAKKQFLSEKLSELRLIHQHLCILTKEISKILHPILLIIITSIVLTHFAAFYGTYNYVVWYRGSHYGAVISLMFIYMVLIRIFPLGAMCYFGENVKIQSTAGKTYLYQVSEQYMNAAFKLQIRLLESKFNNQPAKLHASGFLNLDYRVFIQIAGVMYTYCLVVIQYLDSKKAMSATPPAVYAWQNISAILQMHMGLYNESFSPS